MGTSELQPNNLLLKAKAPQGCFCHVCVSLTVSKISYEPVTFKRHCQKVCNICNWLTLIQSMFHPTKMATIYPKWHIISESVCGGGWELSWTKTLSIITSCELWLWWPSWSETPLEGCQLILLFTHFKTVCLKLDTNEWRQLKVQLVFMSVNVAPWVQCAVIEEEHSDTRSQNTACDLSCFLLFVVWKVMQLIEKTASIRFKCAHWWSNFLSRTGLDG